MKRIMTIQDISCLGKCSLTVALPIISAMGVECAIVPTAVLSTHPKFPGFTFRDLTGEMAPIAEHWERSGFQFDAIYTGYLGSYEQIRLIGEYIDRFKTEDTLVFIDPVMADHGKLYTGFDEVFAREMAKLCARADIIVPNLTEACLLTGTPYREDGDAAYIRDLLHRLAGLGAKKVVLTGVCDCPGKAGVTGMDAATGEIFTCVHDKVDATYHGTGDIFSSTTVGALMRGKSLPEALALAGEFTKECIRVTVESGKQERYGVDFERVLPDLVLQMR